jgi:hypothetical protein
VAPLRQIALAVVCVVASCDKLGGLGGADPPLAQLHIEAAGAPPEGTQSLRIALVWGAVWLPETLCILPPESSQAAAVLRAGCRDPLGFVPLRVAYNAAATPGTPTTIDMVDLPSADDLVGDVTARAAYGSLVVYDDRNGNGTLDLLRAASDRFRGDGNGAPPPDPTPIGPTDVVLGASFSSMSLPDQRVAYREGDFAADAAFYPRNGCAPPPRGFSIVAAGGFSLASALAATLAGTLPAEDPSSCTTQPVDALLTVTMPPNADLREVACLGAPNSATGQVRYREPPSSPPDLSTLTWACTHVPDLGALPGAPDGGVTSGMPTEQLVIADPPTNACKGITHYTLRGCRNDPLCAMPEWDLSQNTPPWWPCPLP